MASLMKKDKNAGLQFQAQFGFSEVEQRLAVDRHMSE
jgi:hypothetical protein